MEYSAIEAATTQSEWFSRQEYTIVPRVLFWNLNRKDLRNLVCGATSAVSADIVILIENDTTTCATLQELKSQVSADFFHPRSTPGRFQLFSRNADLDLGEVHSGDRVSLRRMRLGGTEFLLGMVHLVDKRNWDTANQSAQVHLLVGEIRRKEQELGITRTILVGDFNLNPFDQVMNMAPGMNAMMTKRCVERGKRIQQKEEYPFFYNPMWSLFGDRTDGPAGTYYHSVATSGIYGWNMLDQVLLRPDAIQWFEDVQILTSAGDTSLQTVLERPHEGIGSDHFPILLSLKGDEK